MNIISDLFQNIRQDGLTSVGMSGNKYKGRTYGVLTVDVNDQIIHAEKFGRTTLIYSQGNLLLFFPTLP